MDNYIFINDNMLRKILIPIICSFLLLSALSGCTTQEVIEKNIISTKNIPLDTVILKESDFPEIFTVLDENYSKEPSVQENPTGNELTWYIEERYDATHRDMNSTNGVMQSLLKLNSKENATKLADLSKENLISSDYTQHDIDPIGDISYLLARNFNDTNTSFTYYMFIGSIDTIFIALGGSTEEQSTFINYAKIIENRIINATTNSDS